MTGTQAVTASKVQYWVQVLTKKLEVDLSYDGLAQLQDLGLNCLPLLPQFRVTAFATQSSNKA